MQTGEKTDIFQLDRYQFDLPEELIAQYPVEPRDSSRLLVLNRQTGKWQDRVFTDIVHHFDAGDTLVLNDTRVIPARLYGFKDTGAKIEILLLKKVGETWEALVKPAKRLKTGDSIGFAETRVRVQVLDILPVAGGRLIRFENCEDEEAFLNQYGHVPLPPYINRKDELQDMERYQTVYARHSGSAAAPTAGLHFTRRVLRELQNRGVNIVNVLLHVGLGTFRPVSSEDIRRHSMHSEHYEISAQTAEALEKTRQNGKRITAVGTTVVRTLETVYNEQGAFVPCQGDTNIFIYPGYRFKAIDRLITNFHLPGSSLIMLVAAFAGIDITLAAYHHAIADKYRFFSYGDAMFIE